MSINISGDGGFNPVSPLKKIQQNQKVSTADQGGPKDKVNFSSFLQEANQTNKINSTTAESRAEKIQALKDQIAAGEYNPDPKAVAESLLKNIGAE
jgi:negative regulator of flagellin synthesis FlgM